jgi:hypothetical protein
MTTPPPDKMTGKLAVASNCTSAARLSGTARPTLDADDRINLATKQVPCDVELGWTPFQQSIVKIATGTQVSGPGWRSAPGIWLFSRKREVAPLPGIRSSPAHSIPSREGDYDRRMSPERRCNIGDKIGDAGPFWVMHTPWRPDAQL